MYAVDSVVVGVKYLPKVTFVLLFKIEVSVLSIIPVTFECLNKPSNCPRVLEL